MKLWIRVLAMAILLALAAPVCLAELDEWAETQNQDSFLNQRIRNQQQALGVEVNASVKAQDITDRCKFKVSEGDKGRLTNGKVSSGWSYGHSGAWVGIQLPDGVTPGAIRIEWRFDPTGYELIEYDAAKNVLRTRTLNDSFPSIYTMFALLSETKLIQLKMTAEDQVVVNLKLYSEGVLPNDVQTWLPPVEKADMMVISTHQDDEVIFLGGTIPYSDVVCGRPTVTMYMANCTRNRRREALECLWEMGSRTYPEFLNLTDKRVSTINEGIELWGGKDNILAEMVARIRRYKPEVIVTQDFDGEYGHNQHKITARATPYAIEAAADPTKYPESYQLYGAWQVKKLYIHLYKENEIHMDWLTPQPACGGLTLLKVAQNGMDKHASQLKYYSVKNGGQYDNARFGLYMTQVGPDVEKNDFFENIPADASSNYLEDVAAGRIEAPRAQAAPAADAAVETAALDVPEPLADDGQAEAVEDDAVNGLADDGTIDISAEDTTVGLSGDGLSSDDSLIDASADDAAASGAPDGGAAEVSDPAAQPPQAQSEKKGGAPGLAIALTAAGAAAAGGGAWFLYRRYGIRTRRRARGRARRRAGGVRGAAKR